VVRRTTSRLIYFSGVVHLQGRDQVTARAVFTAWQIFACIVFAVPGRAERVFVDREVVNLRLAVQNADEFVVGIKNPETDCSFHRRRNEPELNSSYRGC